MWSKCMRLVKIRMSIREFHQLPRHPAYKYEYIDGETWLTPRPKTYHALLDLRTRRRIGRRRRRDDAAAGSGRLGRPDRPLLRRLRRPAAVPRPCRPQAPRGRPRHPRTLPHRRRRAADRTSQFHRPYATLSRIRPAASWSRCCRRPTSATGGPSSGAEPPPPDAVARRLGRPHLTWIFVHPFAAGQGAGTALLHAATRRAARPRLHRIGQHVPSRQRVEHALALAQRLPAGGVAVVAPAAVVTARRHGRPRAAALQRKGTRPAERSREERMRTTLAAALVVSDGGARPRRRP